MQPKINKIQNGRCISRQKSKLHKPVVDILVSTTKLKFSWDSLGTYLKFNYASHGVNINSDWVDSEEGRSSVDRRSNRLRGHVTSTYKMYL